MLLSKRSCPAAVNGSSYSTYFLFLIVVSLIQNGKRDRSLSLSGTQRNPTEGLSGPCVAQEGGCGHQSGLGTDGKKAPKIPKFSTCSKRVSNFDISRTAQGATIKMAKANTTAFR